MFRYESDKQVSRREQAKKDAMFAQAAQNASDVNAYNRLVDSQRSAKTQQDIQQREELQKAKQELEIWKAQQEKARQAELESQLKIAEESEDGITASRLYEHGLEARSDHQGIEAATLLWQALICGESRAAYPLFEMLRDGESGVGKNYEMAGLILYSGKVFKSQECRDYGNFYRPDVNLCRELANVYYEAQRSIGKKAITPKIIEMQQENANFCLDLRSNVIKTRAYEEPMTSVFKHDDVEEVRLEVIGNNNSDDADVLCCVIL